MCKMVTIADNTIVKLKFAESRTSNALARTER